MKSGQIYMYISMISKEIFFFFVSRIIDEFQINSGASTASFSSHRSGDEAISNEKWAREWQIISREREN